MYRFPVEVVPIGSRIILYGGGKVGKDYLDQLVNDENYTVLAVVDRNLDVELPYGYHAISINDVKKLGYDYIIIAIDSISLTAEVHDELMYYGMDMRKVIYPALKMFENRVVDYLMMNSRLLLSNIGGRLDKRLTRLEILQYYSAPCNYEKLDEEQKKALQSVQEYQEELRIFPEDRSYADEADIYPLEYTEKNLFVDDKGFYTLLGANRLYFGRDKEEALDMLKGFYLHYEADNPHRYLYPSEDGIDILTDDVVADVGACEGYFGIKYLDCKKVYFFEGENEWVMQLRKSTDKCDHAEVVQGYVGDGESEIRLDSFFEGKERPTVIKMDVEGMELAVLRGAKRILSGKGRLVLLIATYHRQEDWDRIVALLNPDVNNPRFRISHSNGYYWHIPDPKPPYFRRGILRAERILDEDVL